MEAHRVRRPMRRGAWRSPLFRGAEGVGDQALRAGVHRPRRGGRREWPSPGAAKMDLRRATFRRSTGKAMKSFGVFLSNMKAKLARISAGCTVGNTAHPA